MKKMSNDLCERAKPPFGEGSIIQLSHVSSSTCRAEHAKIVFYDSTFRGCLSLSSTKTN